MSNDLVMTIEEDAPKKGDRELAEIAGFDVVPVKERLPAASIALSSQQDEAVMLFKDWFSDLSKPRGTRREDFDSFQEYAEHQAANANKFSAPYFLLEGYAGTGKSTILPFLIESAGLSPSSVLFLAPTGKAAKVVTKKLLAQQIYRTASTVHSAIYRPNQLKAYQLESSLEQAQIEYGLAIEAQDVKALPELSRQITQLKKDLERAYSDDMPSFQLNVTAEAIRNASLVVVDECSMVGMEMAEDLRSFGTPVLAIGDPGQLQPVGDKPGFCVRKADMRLTEVHRQAADNPIIWASMQIRAGKELKAGVHGDGLLRILERKQDDVTYDLDKDAQIIVGTNNRRWQVTRKLRQMQGLHAAGPAKDEMMIICKNSRRYPALVNGTMVRMTEDVGMLEGGDVTFQAKFEDEDEHTYDLECVQSILEEHYLGKGKSTAIARDVFRAKQDPGKHQLDWAYAITCHKSQGSQWNEVIVHNEAAVFREEAQKWLYTAITRASEKLTVVLQ